MAFLTETRVSKHPTKSSHKRLFVAVRIRPLKGNESGRVVHSVDENVVVLEDVEVDRGDVLRQNRGSDKQFVYDAVFNENMDQQIVYDLTTRSLVQDVLQGYNATVFAYGATGSGKTHTMLGSDNNPGIMFRALNDLFQYVQEKTEPEAVNVSMSYLEIYNENIRDLLNPSSGYLELREDNREKTIQVVKLSEISTASTAEVMHLLQKGNKARTMESTAANKTSSRSHALMSVTVRHTLHVQAGQRMRARVKEGRLFMIDLAGSERASQTNNRGKRLMEGAHINRSLLALGNCINALSGGARYVNYRDSKLTRLLKDALSGNSKTCMIAHISPAAIHREESKNTLLYADRARNITNKVGQNVLDISYHVSQYRTIISELRDEISRLRSKMTEERDEDFDSHPVNINRLPNDVQGNRALGQLLSRSEELKSLRADIVQTFKDQMRLRRKLLNIDSSLLTLEVEANRMHDVISEWESKSNRLYQNTGDSATRTGDSTVEKAWDEIAFIEKEQERYAEMRTTTERQLTECKTRAQQLEKSLPPDMSSEEEHEVLRLLVRVHELEIEKIELQSERMMKQHELRQRDLAILRYDRQRQICEEIITRQRQIMEEGRLGLPADLQALYQLYQQELHATTFSEPPEAYAVHPERVSSRGNRENNRSGNREDNRSGNELFTRRNFPMPVVSAQKLPPIEHMYSRRHRVPSIDNVVDDSESSVRTPSSAGSEWLGLPPIIDSPYPGSPGLPPPSVIFPPISKSLQEIRISQPSKLPVPIPRDF